MFQFFVCIFFLAHANGQTSFSYSDQLFWPETFPQCARRRQSPIEICTRNTIVSYIPRLRFFQYNHPLPVPLLVQSKSDSVDVSTVNARNRYLPYVRGGLLKGTYQFESFHFHWGAEDNRGSEHIVNGRQYPFELHIIHRNTKYVTLNDALQRKDGLMVFGILFEISRSDNRALQPIVDAVRSGALTRDSPVNLNTRISLNSLLGTINTNKFFTYSGSLTIPTCNEAVTWIVFSQLTKISRNQLEVFRNFIGSSGERVLNNFRFLQPLNCRPVYRSVGFRKRK